MSIELINLNADLQKLRDEGYDIEVKHNHLLVHDVPYLNADGKICYGVLACTVTESVDHAITSKDHTFFFKGLLPHKVNKEIFSNLIIGENKKTLFDSFEADMQFSTKPPSGKYADNYHKVTHYVRVISAPATFTDNNVTARTKNVRAQLAHESVFHYPDNNSARANIVAVSQKLQDLRIGIIGLGGTGSYILDLIAKTMIKEIHLFDPDTLKSHNGYRSPGAASITDIREEKLKVNYFSDIYSAFRRGIISHPIFVDETHYSNLDALDFVFVCIDSGESKVGLFNYLNEKEIPFIDTGIGVKEVDTKLRGQVRATYFDNETYERNLGRVDLSNREDDEYDDNIQISELNSINACLAVIKWKKYFNFYHDFESESHSQYLISTSVIANGID